MVFTCSKNDLSKAIATVRGAITMAQQTILDSILFDVRDDTATLRAMDKSLAITTRIPAIVQESGRIAVPAKLLSEFVAHLPDAETTVRQISDSVVEIQCQTAKGRLQLMNHEEFPAVPPVHRGKGLHIPSDVLASMINSTMFAASTNEDRPILTGILFDLRPQSLTLAAVDGFRVAVREEPVVSDVEGKYVVPARALKQISRALGDTTGDMDIFFEDGRVMFATESTHVVAQLLEGDFVRYETYFPQTFSTHIQVGRELLRESLERADIIASQNLGTHVIQFQLADNVLEIGASAQTASSTEPIPVIMRGEDITISLNARFLLDVLKAVDDPEITITFNTPTTPCAIQRKGMQAYRYLILPVLTHRA